MRYPGHRLVRAIARLVPLTRRRDWRREWEAEATWGWKSLHTEGPPGLGAQLRFRLRILSCVIDALWERKQTMRMTGLMNDLRFALRSLGRNRAFAVVAVLTLALGIGANTAVFTLVDGVLLRPLPYPDSDRLVALRHQGRDGQDQLPISQGLYQFYREQASSLEEVAMYAGVSMNLVLDGEAQRLQGQAVTPSFFSVLGAEATLGRTFAESEGAPGGEEVVLLSYGFWRDSFGGDPSVLGRSLDLNGRLAQVVGVMPPEFGFPDRRAHFWLPLQVDPANAQLASFGAGGMARFAPGSSVAGVQAELEGLLGRLPEFFPENGAVDFLEDVGLAPIVLPMKEQIVGNVRTTLWVLLGTVGLVLLIACANVANLLLVRAEGRQRELALREALGAGRSQILRWFMSESLVLTTLGGALGVGVAAFAVRSALGYVPTDIPRMAEVGMDVRVLSFTMVIALGCALFFGLFPLLRHGREDLAAELRDGAAHGATGGKSRLRLRNGLVVAQMALALVLLIGSGLMFRSFDALRSVDPGFDQEGIMIARVTVPGTEIDGWEGTDAFFRQLGERLRAVPGVEAVGYAQGTPLVSGASAYFSIESEDHPRGPDDLPVFAMNNAVSPGFAEALGLRILEGRPFQDGDDALGARAIMVNRTFAEMWWPGESPIGRRLRLGYEGEDWYNIVAVVADAHYESLESAPAEMVYWPMVQGPAESPSIARAVDVVVRTGGDPAQLVPVLRREVQALNPRIPVSNPTTMAQAFRQATARTSFTMALLGVASGTALLLGLVGIYGVISYVVSQRTREIGVRIALGASGSAVRGMVVRQGLTLASLGVAIGVAAALGLSSFMASLLYGVSATDPVTYVVLALALVGTATLASWVPAHRAARVDPSRALRAD